MHDEFNKLLLQEARAGRRMIIVVDEAQNLHPSVLETIRLLSDFESPTAKLLQIILAGQSGTGRQAGWPQAFTAPAADFTAERAGAAFGG